MIFSISKNKEFEKDNVAEKMEQAKIIMNENVCKEIDPEELAEKLNISYSWFRKTFKKYTGYSPAKYFQELKLRKAKQMLINTSYPVKEICFMIGYTSTEHFSNLFKKIQDLLLWNIVHSVKTNKYNLTSQTGKRNLPSVR